LYAQSFGSADEILLAPVGRPGLDAERLDTEKLAGDLRNGGKVAAAYPDVESIVQSLTARARPGDVIALLSNGAFGGIHQRLLAALAG
jgi:UDP-N-acetylmuramate: L-alanyl-gamma-D-glutamyl-meso-diaminopimelate ligase